MSIKFSYESQNVGYLADMRAMLRIFLGVTTCLFGLTACTFQQQRNTGLPEGIMPNQLISAPSPYLQQHAYLAVKWEPWYEDALERAQLEKKPLLISLGYASCYWCHEMARTTFTDSSVVSLLNTDFVPVLVDREERPDLDYLYLHACQVIGDQPCGWPLNVVALPDGRPLRISTYQGPASYEQFLLRSLELYQQAPATAEELAASAIAPLSPQPTPPQRSRFSPAQLTSLSQAFLQQADFRHGGQQGAPKFPLPGNYRFLLDQHRYQPDPELLRFTEITLHRLADGGIYDHLGGGFSRHAIDDAWQVPRFEKMLADNAQLVGLYADAFRQTYDPRYEQIVYESLAFVAREMTSPEGGFYASVDAETEGQEGFFYTWEQIEVDMVLGADAELFSRCYNLTERGNWLEDKNILYRTLTDAQLSAAYGLELATWQSRLSEMRDKMFLARQKRVKPAVDRKVITAWNALMIKGYLEAYRSFDELPFLLAAEQAAELLKARCLDPDFRLYRFYEQGQAHGNGFLSDYAYTADAFIALYQVSCDERWLELARELTIYALTHFYNPGTGLFYLTSDLEAPLFLRPQPVADDVLPSANAVMAQVLYQLGRYYEQDAFRETAKDMLRRVTPELANRPFYHYSWARLLQQMVYEPPMVALLGPDWERFRQQLDRSYLTPVLFTGGRYGGQLPKLKRLPPVNGQSQLYLWQPFAPLAGPFESVPALSDRLPGIEAPGRAGVRRH